MATSSVASKKQVEEAKAAKEAAEAESAAQVERARVEEEAAAQATEPEAGGDADAAKVADWEDERNDEETALQSLVDRLHDKGEKEVNRIVKVCHPLVGLH